MGHALPELRERLNPLTSSAVVGTLWGGWHCNGLLGEQAGSLQFLDVLFLVVRTVSASVIYTWLFNNTRGSLPIVCLVHSVYDVTVVWVLVVLPLPPSATRVGMVGLGGSALVIILLAGLQLSYQAQRGVSAGCRKHGGVFANPCRSKEDRLPSMRYGISAAALVLDDDRLLLVNHREPGAYDFWLPPGGKLQGSESILDCAQRETFEETGLTIEPDRILYVQEFAEPGYHFVKFFILCNSFSGELTLSNRDADESWLVDAAFLSQQEMQGIQVLPSVLKGQFWADLAAGFRQTAYLGLEALEF